MRRLILLLLIAIVAVAVYFAMGAARSTEPLSSSSDQSRILIDKSERRLTLYEGETIVRTYRIGLGTKPVPDKVKQGDRATPEGEFTVLIKNPRSDYTLSLGLNYPTVEDAARGLAYDLISQAEHDAIVDAHRRGVMPPQNTALGGDIYIHGGGSGKDWTWGCVALDDDDIRALYAAVREGTVVSIRP